jgi:tRNA A58 N-methylase Trm61
MTRMRELEQIDAHDRVDGTPHEKRLRQISPEVGRFIAIFAASAPDGRYIEIGTSAGYSTMWLSLACRVVGRRITTFEILTEKVQLARKTIDSSGISDWWNSSTAMRCSIWQSMWTLLFVFWIVRKRSMGAATSWSCRVWLMAEF